jgi:hypothetical protein
MKKPIQVKWFCRNCWFHGSTAYLFSDIKGKTPRTIHDAIRKHHASWCRATPDVVLIMKPGSDPDKPIGVSAKTKQA